MGHGMTSELLDEQPEAVHEILVWNRITQLLMSWHLLQRFL